MYHGDATTAVARTTTASERHERPQRERAHELAEPEREPARDGELPAMIRPSQHPRGE
jgi:hypothetical protein